MSKSVDDILATLVNQVEWSVGPELGATNVNRKKEEQAVDEAKQALYTDLIELLDIPVYEIADASPEFIAGYNTMVHATRTLQLQQKSAIKDYLGIEDVV